MLHGESTQEKPEHKCCPGVVCQVQCQRIKWSLLFREVSQINKNIFYLHEMNPIDQCLELTFGIYNFRESPDVKIYYTAQMKPSLKPSCGRTAPQIHACIFPCSVEHPAAGYKKIFETVEELNEPLPAEISGKKERGGCSMLFLSFSYNRKSLQSRFNGNLLHRLMDCSERTFLGTHSFSF